MERSCHGCRQESDATRRHKVTRCILLTFFKLLDASIVSLISSKLCFRISSLAFFFMVLHISTYSIWCLGVLFSIISLRLFIRALVGDDIFSFFYFLVWFAILIPLCSCFSVRVETCSNHLSVMLGLSVIM